MVLKTNDIKGGFMKTLLFFEEYESNLSYALRARRDINTVFIRTNKNLKFFTDEYLEKYKDYYLIDYFNDMDDEVNKFKGWLLLRNIKIDYFLNDSEYYMRFSNDFARRLGLECLSEEQVSWVRDKVLMKDKFRNIGLKTVEYSPIKSIEDIKSFYLKSGNKKIVVKPRSGMNSLDVYVLNNIDDIESLPIDLSKGNYMVELFTPYHEWSIESLVQNGKVLDSYLTYIPSSTIEAAINCKLNCHMQLIEYPNYFETNPKTYIQTIVDGMGLKNGAMTIEVFVSPSGEIYASEMGWRFPGCQTTTNISISRGFNIYDTLIDISIHKDVKLKYKKDITCPGDIYLPNKEGIIENFTSLEEISKMPGFVKGKIFIKKGDVVKKKRLGTDASGWVIVQSKDPKTTMEMMKYIYDNYKIIVKEEGKSDYVKTKKI